MNDIDPSQSFNGRVALVTGGASGIGRGCAEAFVARGGRAALFDLNGDAAASVAAEIGDAAEGFGGDVTSSEDLVAAVSQIEAQYGSVDVLVCAAGVGGDTLRTAEVTDQEWRRVFAVNCDGVFYANRAVIPGMVDRGYGRIVNIASIAGKEGNPQATAYSASKAAVIGMTKSIGKDLVGTGVLVSSVAPAVIRTPLLDQLTEEHVEYMLEKIPLRRAGSVEEVANLVCYLGSEALSFSTGACFDISGGRATY